MKVCGIIAEYNPFHNGHKYQIEEARKCLGADYLIVAMSGDFVQRGTPAIFDKYTRAHMALLAGADLVLELPVSIATGSAERFALGGVTLLDSLGVVNDLCFGSEAGDLSALCALSRILACEPPEFQQKLREALTSGYNFPQARAMALSAYLTSKDSDTASDFRGYNLPENLSSEELQSLLSSPNNLLGIEYCKAIDRIHSSIRPFTIKRLGLSYHDSGNPASERNPSATFLRKLLLDSQGKDSFEELSLSSYVPEELLLLYKECWDSRSLLSEDSLDLLLHLRLLENSKDFLTRFMDVSPALADRIIRLSNRYQGFTSFAELLKTRELTYTRIQRALLHIVLETASRPNSDLLSYIHVLGFRKEASPLLKEIKRQSRLPLITKASQYKSLSPEISDREIRENLFVSNLYESLLQNKNKQAFRHEYEKPVIIL